MQLTSLLSDLNSLRACDPSAALKLVSLRPSLSSSSPPSSSTSQSNSTSQALKNPTSATSTSSIQESDPDLARPASLLHLHRTVKLAYTSSIYSGKHSTLSELRDARNDVQKVLAGLGPGANRIVEDSSTVVEPHESLSDADEEVAAWS